MINNLKERRNMRGVSVLPQTALEIQSLLKTFFFGVVERIQEES